MSPLFTIQDNPLFQSLLERIDRLGAAPPQVLLLEGGTETERLETAKYWACRCNCPNTRERGRPCLSCTTCRQIAEHEYLDLLAYDGRISNKDDQEAPGPIRALNTENTRLLKSMVSDPPHGQGVRVVILMGIEDRRSEAANGLLKTLEEPSDSTVFVLLTPQREQLLPTLVSRSFSLTLPWPDPEDSNQDDLRLTTALQEFLQTGRGLFDMTGSKSYGPTEARSMLAILQRALIRLIAGEKQESGTLTACLEGLSDKNRILLAAWLDEAQRDVTSGVTPGRVMESLMANLFMLLHPQG